MSESWPACQHHTRKWPHNTCWSTNVLFHQRLLEHLLLHTCSIKWPSINLQQTLRNHNFLPSITKNLARFRRIIIHFCIRATVQRIPHVIFSTLTVFEIGHHLFWYFGDVSGMNDDLETNQCCLCGIHDPRFKKPRGGLHFPKLHQHNNLDIKHAIFSISKSCILEIPKHHDCAQFRYSF